MDVPGTTTESLSLLAQVVFETEEPIEDAIPFIHMLDALNKAHLAGVE
jgi:hypothetical protein